jgi:hypothetical protein
MDNSMDKLWTAKSADHGLTTELPTRQGASYPQLPCRTVSDNFEERKNIMSKLIMQAQAIVFQNRATLNWTVNAGKNWPTVIELKSESGELVRRFEGKTLGICENRRVVFALPARQLKDEEAVGRLDDLNYVDLIHVDCGIADLGMVRARMFRPLAAVALARLAAQKRAGSVEKAKLQSEIDRHSCDAINFDLEVTEFGAASGT